MTDRGLEDFLIYREIDPPVTHAERERASERSTAALETVRDDGNAIEWVRSEIMTNEDDEVTATLCHFRAESEDAIYDHGDCAGIPVSKIYRRSPAVDGPGRSEDA